MGSHAIRLQIVEVTSGGQGVVLQSQREPVRLGGDLFRTGAVSEPAIADAAGVFARFAEACRLHGVTHIRAIATAAARQAGNRQQLLERIEESSGIRVEVISGEQEAPLLFAAVEKRIDLVGGRTLVADVGGGSVELLVVDDGNLSSAASFPFGALWLLSAMTREGAEALENARLHLAELDEQARELLGNRPLDRYAITGGGSSSLADMLQQKGEVQTLDGVESYSIRSVEQLVEELASMSLEERLQIPGLPSDRADTVVAGGMIYLRLGELAGTDSVFVPRVGLRDGLLREFCDGGGHA